MRNFFYNKGDVLIAILIILAAAVIIYWRVGVIMDYSASGKEGESLLPPISSFFDGENDPLGIGSDGSSGETDPADGVSQEPSGSSAVTTPDQTVQPEPVTGEPSEPADDPAEPVNEPSDTAGDPVEPVNEPSGPTEEDPPEDIAPVKITVSAGDAASTIADKLLSAGAIADKQEFLKEVSAQGADSKLKAGSFTIPAGATYAEIITILVG